MELKIRQLREEAGLSQKALAHKAKISQGKVSEYESGKSIPRLDSARRIADALGVSIDELVEAEIS
jgi:transcriptional regulator with XRE-family HTH domain